jgi:subtilisin family serine protease
MFHDCQLELQSFLTGDHTVDLTIAIVDTALEIGHEDLVDNVLAGKSWNFATNTNDPSPSANQTSLDHGTGVAGVASLRA